MGWGDALLKRAADRWVSDAALTAALSRAASSADAPALETLFARHPQRSACVAERRLARDDQKTPNREWRTLFLMAALAAIEGKTKDAALFLAPFSDQSACDSHGQDALILAMRSPEAAAANLPWILPSARLNSVCWTNGASALSIAIRVLIPHVDEEPWPDDPRRWPRSEPFWMIFDEWARRGSGRLLRSSSPVFRAVDALLFEAEVHLSHPLLPGSSVGERIERLFSALPLTVLLGAASRDCPSVWNDSQTVQSRSLRETGRARIEATQLRAAIDAAAPMAQREDSAPNEARAADFLQGPDVFSLSIPRRSRRL